MEKILRVILKLGVIIIAMGIISNVIRRKDVNLNE